jgi:hypothetical protein
MMTKRKLQSSVLTVDRKGVGDIVVAQIYFAKTRHSAGSAFD